MGELKQNDKKGLTDAQLEALLSLNRIELKERSKQLSRDELVRINRIATRNLSSPSAGTREQSKQRLGRIEEAEQRDGFPLDPTRPQAVPDPNSALDVLSETRKTPSIVEQQNLVGERNREFEAQSSLLSKKVIGIFGFPGRVGKALANPTIFGESVPPQDRTGAPQIAPEQAEAISDELTVAAFERGRSSIQTEVAATEDSPDARAYRAASGRTKQREITIIRQQLSTSLSNIDRGLFFVSRLMNTQTEESAIAGSVIVGIAESWTDTLLGDGEEQESFEVLMNTIDFLSLGFVSAFTKSKKVISGIDEAIELGTRTVGSKQTAVALDSAIDATREASHAARNAGNREAVERLKGLLVKVEKEQARVAKMPDKVIAAPKLTDAVRAKNLEANSEAVLGVQLGKLPDRPLLGLSRKPILDTNLENLSDDAFELKESIITKNVDDIEKQFDGIVTDTDGVETLNGEPVPPGFFNNMARVQDEFDAVERESLRRRARDSDTIGVVDLLRNLNLRRDSGKADLVAIIRGVVVSGKEREVRTAILQIAKTSPDHAEIMMGVVDDIKKVTSELGEILGKNGKGLAGRLLPASKKEASAIAQVIKQNPEAGSVKKALIVNMASGAAGAGLANYLYNEPGEHPFTVHLIPTLVGGFLGFGTGNIFTSASARNGFFKAISVPGAESTQSTLFDALVPDRYISHVGAESVLRKSALGAGVVTGGVGGGFAGRREGEGFSPMGAALGALAGGVVGSGAGQFINLKSMFKGGFNPNLAIKQLFTTSGGMDPAFIGNRTLLRKRHSAIMQRIEDAALPVLRAVRKDPEVGNKLSAIARGLEADTTGIPESVLNANSELRGLFDELGENLISVGLAQGKVAETITENIGTYLPRLYMAHEKSDAVDTVLRYMGRNGIPRERLGDLAGLKKRKDLTPEVREALGEITEEFGTGNPGLLGVKRLPRTAADVYVADNARFIASSPDLSIPIGVSKKIGKDGDQTKLIFSEGSLEIREFNGRRYRKMPDNRNLGNIKNRWVEDAIAQDMLTMVELPSNFRKFIDMGTAFFKASKVVWNMGTLFRNNVSNFIQADAFGGLSMTNLPVYSQAFADYFAHNPGRIGSAAKKLAEKGGFKDVVGAGIGATAGAVSGDDVDPLRVLAGAAGGFALGRAAEKSRVWLGGKPIVGRPERYKMWRDLGLFEGGFFMTEVEKFLPEIFKRGYTGSESTVAGIFDKLRQYTLDQGSKWHQASEQFSKVAMANYSMDTLKLTPEQAVTRAQKYIYNYQDVPRIVDTLRRSPVGIPFVTFSYKTIPRVAESAISFGSLTELGKVPGQLAKGQFGAASGSALNNKFMRFWKWPTAIGAMNEYSAHLFGLKEGEDPTTPLGAAFRFGKDALARPFSKLRDVVMEGIGVGDATGLKEFLPEWKGPHQILFPGLDNLGRVGFTDATWNLPWGDLTELNQDRLGPSSPWWQTGVALSTGLYELTQKPVITPGATAAQAAMDVNEFLWKQWGPTWAAQGFGSESVRKAFSGQSLDRPDVPTPSTAIMNLLGVPKTTPVVPGASLTFDRIDAEKKIKALDKQKKTVLKTLSPSEQELAQKFVRARLVGSEEFMSTKSDEAAERFIRRTDAVELKDLSPNLRSKAKKLLALTLKQVTIGKEALDKAERAKKLPDEVFFPEKFKEALPLKDDTPGAEKARKTLEFLKGQRK